MLAGTLPFGKDFTQCPRFQAFKKWTEGVRSEDNKASLDTFESYPDWFFPSHLTTEVKQLLLSLLDPNPNVRITINTASKHPWVLAASIPPLQEEEIKGDDIDIIHNILGAAAGHSPTGSSELSSDSSSVGALLLGGGISKKNNCNVDFATTDRLGEAVGTP